MAKVLKELMISYREFFESELAIDIANHSDNLASIRKISLVIVSILEEHREQVIDLINKDTRIAKELCQPYFGALYDCQKSIVANEAFTRIVATLKNPQSAFDQIMQIHCIFIYRIYDRLMDDAKIENLRKALHPDRYFSVANRARVSIPLQDVSSTTQLGITRNPVFSKRLGHSYANHQRGMDQFRGNSQSAFFKDTQENNLPFVCGPSSHTASLMLGALLYGRLNHEELQEYTMACFAFLTAGGNHSFHEVMVIASLAGVHYHCGDYEAALPKSFKITKSYQHLSKRFPEFLSEYGCL